MDLKAKTPRCSVKCRAGPVLCRLKMPGFRKGQMLPHEIGGRMLD